MKDVAAYKWLNGRPIEDLAREEAVLESAATAALRVGVTQQSSRHFFSVQIRAAKEIQAYWFTVWRAGAEPHHAPDLDTELRPRLIDLGSAITDQLAGPVPAQDANRFKRVVTVAGLSDTTRDALFEALLAVRLYPDRLTQILESGKLRVGTTGDYAPFSYLKDRAFLGIDVDMAQDLAQSLDVEVVFTQTSWPMLMEDLVAGKYDIAMSGVSRSLARQRKGYFSHNYHTGGKTPIIRCSDRDRFRSLSDIDRSGVRLIVNPGGTNERYVDGHIEHATKLVHADNRTIFEEIASGEADIMITDGIEVDLQTARNALLCAAMPGHFLTHLEKGYLMPRDTPLKEYVDLWLEQRIADGTVERLFSRHLR